MKRYFLIATAVIIVMISACPKKNMTTKTENVSMQEKIRFVRLSSGEAQMCSRANRFALHVFKYTIEAIGNKSLTLSPLSMIYSLGMINNGAGGNTSRQICEVTGFTGGTDSINAFCHKIINEFARIDSTTTMSIANAAIINKRLNIKGSFIDALKNNYDAMAEICNFNKKSAANKVNAWCAEKTDGMIDNMTDDIRPDDAAIIANAIYFKGLWKNKFYKDDTKKDKFKAADGTVKEVDMMQKTRWEKYSENETFSAVSMRYGNGHYSMQIILPKEGKSISDVIETINKKEWKNIVDNMESGKINMMMPRFSIEYAQELKGMFTDMGADDMFNRKKADMSKLCESNAWISSIIHKAKIEVDEEGTRAAAATGAVTIGAFDIEKAQTIKFKADRPFLFVITERNTGMICFIGQYTGI